MMFLRGFRAARRTGSAVLTMFVAASAAGLSGCAIAETAAGPGALPGSAQFASRTAPEAETVRPTAFGAYVESLWPAARARGVSRKTFDSAMRGLSPDPKIVELTRKQSEFVRPIWEYLDGAVGQARLQRGGEAAARHASTLNAVERAYGVPKEIVLGVWGMETNFGSFTGSMDVFRSLATLAHLGYRGDFFRDELITALVILERGHVARSKMTGSWAGAMGQTQFMPSSYVKYAVDGDGDGKADIWGSIPDALASTANYLKEHGWRPGLPWGMEVTLPGGFDFRQREADFAQWASLGLRKAGGAALPATGRATLFLPGGAGGPAFLVTENYDVIKRYNSSDAYAMGVAHLGDRLYGGRAITAKWPRNEPMLDAGQRKELQSRLAALGFYSGDTDGKLGSMTREAVRQFQMQQGITPDGYANVAVLDALRRTR